MCTLLANTANFSNQFNSIYFANFNFERFECQSFQTANDSLNFVLTSVRRDINLSSPILLAELQCQV